MSFVNSGPKSRPTSSTAGPDMLDPKFDPKFRVFSNPEIAAHLLDPNKNVEFASYSSVQLTTRPATMRVNHISIWHNSQSYLQSLSTPRHKQVASPRLKDSREETSNALDEPIGVAFPASLAFAYRIRAHHSLRGDFAMRCAQIPALPERSRPIRCRKPCIRGARRVLETIGEGHGIPLEAEVTRELRYFSGLFGLGSCAPASGG